MKKRLHEVKFGSPSDFSPCEVHEGACTRFVEALIDDVISMTYPV